MLANAITKFLSSALRVTTRTTSLQHKHDSGSPLEHHKYYNLLFNISVLGGSSLKNHNQDLKVLLHDDPHESPCVYSMEKPTPLDLCEFVHISYGGLTDPNIRFDKHKLSFASNVMFNIERYYSYTSQISIEEPGVVIKNNDNEHRLLALDRKDCYVLELFNMYLTHHRGFKNVTGIDIYDSWKNEITHLDIKIDPEVAKMFARTWRP
jgi:hypothetical protein